MSSQRGMSLVEVTIILTVLSVLAAMAAPSMNDYINDARQTAAKGDAEAIGSGVLQLLKDTGSRCLRLAGTTDCTVTNRVDLLVSGGNNPVAVDASVADVTLPDPQAATSSPVNWLPDAQAPTQQDTVDEQLITNATTPYNSLSFTAGGGPRMKLGWRGAYLNGPIGGDPWGRKYQMDALFLAVATNAFDNDGPGQNQEGLRETAWLRDVLVVSSGINGIVETSFGGTASGGVAAGGDDVIYVLGGTTR